MKSEFERTEVESVGWRQWSLVTVAGVCLLRNGVVERCGVDRREVLLSVSYMPNNLPGLSKCSR